MRSMKHARLPLVAAASLMATSVALAETNPRNIAVATRAVGFMVPKLAGVTPVAVVHAAGDSASEADANQIARALSSASVNGLIFKPQLVASNDLGAISRVKVVFVASRTPNQAAVFNAASKAHAVTISFDMGCVAAGHCIVGVRTSPKVEIVVSRAARQASGINFSQAFLMLVTEQ
jgi:hypothetical protein